MLLRSFGAEKTEQIGQYFIYHFHLLLTYLLHVLFHEANASGYFAEQNNTTQHLRNTHTAVWNMCDRLILRLRLLKLG